MPIAGRRQARIEIGAKSKGLDRALREARRKLKAFRRDEEKEEKRKQRALGTIALPEPPAEKKKKKKKKEPLGNVIAGAIGTFAGNMMSSAASGIGGMLMDTAGEVLNVERKLTRFQIATNQSHEAMSQFRDQMNHVSKDSGIARESLMDGAAAYVALTGDSKGAAKGMEIFAKVANATGASMADIAATASSMKQNLGIAPKDFEAGFSALAVQGKAGAVELRELATELSGIAPGFAKFKGGGGTAGLVEMGAALQVVRQGFGSTSEAATGMRSLMKSLQANADKFGKVGIKVFDKDPKTHKKTLRGFSAILNDIGKSKKLMNDPKLLGDTLGGSGESQRTLEELLKSRALMDELITKSSDVNAISRDAATYQESSAGKIEAAWNNIKVTIAESFTPDRIDRFADVVGKVAVWVEDIVGWIEYLLGEKESYEQKEKKEFHRDEERRTAKAQRVFKGATKQQARAGVTFEQLMSGAYSRGDFDVRGIKELATERAGVEKNADSYVNPQARLNALDTALERLMKAQFPTMVAGLVTKDLVRAGLGTVVLKLDGAVVATSGANSPTNRDRPGGS